MASELEPSRVSLGHINGVFGVRGWVKVWSDTSPPEGILNYRDWWLGDGRSWKRVKVLDGKRQGKLIVAQLDGCDDRDQAAALRGLQIAVSKDSLPRLPQGEYYWHQLVGLEVYVDTNGGEQMLGKVDHLLETGANDVIVVRACGGSIDDRERLLPWIPEQVVKMIDLGAGRMQVDWDPEF